MKLLIAIPSKGRAERILKYTLRYVPELGTDWRVFVEPQDYASYAKFISSEHLVQLSDNNRGLGYSKCEIAAYAQGYDLVFKMDDDIRFWSKGSGSNSENSLETPQILLKAIKAILSKLKQHPQLKAVSFEYKNLQHLYNKSIFSPNRRLQTAYICRTKELYPREDVSTFEDFYTTLAIWVNGGYTARYNDAGMYIEGDVGVMSGGLQSFDRAAMALRELQIMKRLYPGLKVREVKHAWKYEPDLNAVARELRSTVWKMN